MIRSLWTWSVVGMCAAAALARAQDAPPPPTLEPVVVEPGTDAPPPPTIEAPEAPAPFAPAVEPTVPAPGIVPGAVEMVDPMGTPSLTPNEFVDGPRPLTGTVVAPSVATWGEVYPHVQTPEDVVAPWFDPGFYGVGTIGTVGPWGDGGGSSSAFNGYSLGGVGCVGCGGPAGAYGYHGEFGYAGGYGSPGYYGAPSQIGLGGTVVHDGFYGHVAPAGGHGPDIVYGPAHSYYNLPNVGWFGYWYTTPYLDGIWHLGVPLWRGPGDRYDVLNVPPPGGMYNAWGRVVPGSEANRLLYPRVVHALLIGGGTADPNVAPLVDASLRSIETALGHLPKVKTHVEVFAGPDANNATIFEYIKGLKTTHEDAILVYYVGPGASQLPEGQVLLPASAGPGQTGQPLLRSDIPRLLKMKHHRLAVFITDPVTEVLTAPADAAPYEPTPPADVYVSSKPPAIVPLLLLNSGFWDISTAKFDPYATAPATAYGVADRGSLATSTFAGLATSLVASTKPDGYVTWDEFVTLWQDETAGQLLKLKRDADPGAGEPAPAGQTFESFRP